MKNDMKAKLGKTGVLRRVLLILLSLALIFTAGACMCTSQFLAQGTYVKDQDADGFADAEEFETLPEEDEKDLLRRLLEERLSAFAELTGAGSGKPAKTKPESGVSDQEEDMDVFYSDQVYNLMLIGVDRRDSSWNGNSDTMILLSINYEKQKVTMTSFMRDTWVNIPGVGMRKMNAAFAIGNGPLLMKTVAANFGISVDNYAWIDFKGMKSAIDTLGGVDVELTAAEGKYIGVPVTGDSSVVHLNGEKALAYARDRTTSGWDYGRTQRQRNILMAIVNKAKSGGFTDRGGVVNAVLPYMTYTIDQARMTSLMLNLPKITGFTFQEQRVPYDGLYHSENQNLVPDYGETIKRLYSAIY